MKRVRTWSAFLLALTIFALPAVAGPPVADKIAACVHDASKGRPWLEKTLWGLYDQEGGWPGAEIANSNGSADLGPMQVNDSWVPLVADGLHRDRRDVRRWLRDDVCFNVGTAAWLFLTGYSHARDYWKAVGVYHSPTPWRARAYARNVADRLRRRFGFGVFRRPSPRRLRPPLVEARDRG